MLPPARPTLGSALLLHRFLDKGGVYKLAFGPKAFIVLSDPVVVRHILKVCCAAGLQLHSEHVLAHHPRVGPWAARLQRALWLTHCSKCCAMTWLGLRRHVSVLPAPSR